MMFGLGVVAGVVLMAVLLVIGEIVEMLGRR